MKHSDSEPVSPRRIVVFVHVPKAAGTTLRRLMDRQYPQEAVHRCDMQLHPAAFKELCELSPERMASLRCLIGHLPYGIHGYLPAPVDYVTILRNPVDRFLSKYGFLKNNQWVVDELGLEEREVASLEAFVDAQLKRNAMNVQTRQISGEVDFHDPMPPFTEPVTSETLSRASNNLANEFAVVGLQERFNESLVLMKRAFDWGDVTYQRRNVTPKRVRQSKASPRMRDLIEQHNALDMELFEFAKQLFEQRLPEDAKFRKELSALRKGNERNAKRERIRSGAGKLVRKITRRLAITGKSR